MRGHYQWVRAVQVTCLGVRLLQYDCWLLAPLPPPRPPVAPAVRVAQRHVRTSVEPPPVEGRSTVVAITGGVAGGCYVAATRVPALGVGQGGGRGGQAA